MTEDAIRQFEEFAKKIRLHLVEKLHIKLPYLRHTRSTKG